MREIILQTIKFYQLFISPYLGSNCRFYPSCSEYFAQRVKEEGALKGSLKGFWRVLRCNPFNKGGVDIPCYSKNKNKL
jgi:uncharacterized protein